MSAPRKCRKCGQSIQLRSVGKNLCGVIVRKWCRAENMGTPGIGAPIDCPRGGYHEPLAQLGVRS